MEEQGMGMREYRIGNWTLQETMILVEAKKMDDERRKLNKKQTCQNIIASPSSPRQRLNPGSATGSHSTSSSVIVKPVAELRWKWVEEYCWRKGCLRSQNQCNDKWDNLMRDYKKIRDCERNLGDTIITVPASPRPSQEGDKTINKSYWEMDKVERKDKSLPTNMLPQIYEALFDVVEHFGSTSQSGILTTTTTTAAANVVASAGGGGGAQFLQLPPPPSIWATMPLREPPVSRLQTQFPFYSQQGQQPGAHHLRPELDSEASEHLRAESSAKKRRKEERAAGMVEGRSSETQTRGHRRMATTSAATTSVQGVSSSIWRSASIISETIQSNVKKQERRQKEIMDLHETRLRIEESRLEVTRQGFIGLSDAITNLANSLLTWPNTSHNSHHHAP